MVKIAILSPKNAKLVVDNPLVLAQFGDRTFTNYTLTMRGLKNLWSKTKSSLLAELLVRLVIINACGTLFIKQTCY